MKRAFVKFPGSVRPYGVEPELTGPLPRPLRSLPPQGGMIGLWVAAAIIAAPGFYFAGWNDPGAAWVSGGFLGLALLLVLFTAGISLSTRYLLQRGFPARATILDTYYLSGKGGRVYYVRCQFLVGKRKIQVSRTVDKETYSRVHDGDKITVLHHPRFPRWCLVYGRARFRKQLEGVDKAGR